MKVPKLTPAYITSAFEGKCNRLSTRYNHYGGNSLVVDRGGDPAIAPRLKPFLKKTDVACKRGGDAAGMPRPLYRGPELRLQRLGHRWHHEALITHFSSRPGSGAGWRKAATQRI